MVDFSFSQSIKSVFLVLLVLLQPAAPATAQNTNPAPDPSCGLPLQGTIHSDVTYTLTADCTLTHRIRCSKIADADSQVTITVNGGNNTINARNDGSQSSPDYWDVFRMARKCSLSLNNVTINGGGYQGTAAVTLTDSDYASSFSNVTFRNTVYNALQFDDQRENSPGTTHTLSNVLIKDTTGSYVQAQHGHPSGIQAIGKVNLNINNLALRNVRGGNSAIGANDTFIVGRNVTKGTITLTGCLTVDGVFPRVIYGNFVDNSAGPCSGSVGNGGSSAMQYPQAPVSTCGLPLSGFIYGTRVFSLKSDCALSGPLYIAYESNVVINGAMNTIDAAAAGEKAIAVAGAFSLKNVVISGTAGSPVVTYLDKRMSIANAEFRDNMGPLHIQDSFMTLNKVLIENHSVTSAAIPSAVLVSKSAQVSIRDSVLRGNTGGQGALYTGMPDNSNRWDPPATTLAGCITFENNSPVDILDPNSLLTDNRSGPCPPGMTFLGNPNPPAANQPLAANHPPATSGTPARHNSPPPSKTCDGKLESLLMGAVACVFRHPGELAVYGLDEQSQGFFMVAATQAQIDAVDAGMVASSPEGRAAIFASEGGDIIVSVGPDHEGKILHLRLENGVGGRAINLITTFGGPPSLGFAPAIQARPRTRALQDCMVTTLYILNFRDAPGGNIKYFLPYNVTLTAFERAADWFLVDYHGDRGWIHADYVRTHGSCG